MKIPSLVGFVAVVALTPSNVLAFTGHDYVIHGRKQSVCVTPLRAFFEKQQKQGKGQAADVPKDTDRIEKFQVSSSRGSNAIRKGSFQIENKNVWSSLKKAIYGTVDGVGDLSSKLTSKSSDTGVEDGYLAIEQSILRETGRMSPGERLMNEYRERSATSGPVESNSGGGKGNAFDSFKATLYDGIDAASSVFDDKKSDEELRRSFKPLVQSTLSSPEIQEALPDLQSSNIFARKIAEDKIKNWERKERKRQRALEREEAARKFKESVYQATDATVWAVKSLATAPEKVSRAATGTKVFVKGTVEQVKGTVEQAVDTAASIPDQVTAKSDEVQKAVKTSVEKTKRAVEDVKSIPTRIKESIDDTKQTVNAVVTAVEEVAVDTKVLVGLEKPKPKPPKRPPPPPPSVSERGLELAKTVLTGAATGTAKLAWWAGKESAAAAWNLTVSTYQQATAGEKAQPELTTSGEGKTTKSGSGIVSKSTNEEPSIDKEVQEALWLAQSAIDFADKESPPKDDDKKTP